MIAKHIPIRSLRKSSFAELVSYLTDTQGHSERVGQVRVTNCEAQTMPAVCAEVLATQAQNKRARGDKTFHLLVSLRAGESPDDATLAAIETRLCDGLGFAAHQRVSVVHHDTDNLHIHVAINAIHPTRKTMHNPGWSYRTMGELCQELEREHGLEADNHQRARKVSAGRAADMEHQSGIESLAGWIKRECLDSIRAADSWAVLHAVMESNGLTLRQRANGFILSASDGTTVKASTVARDLSKPKLEARLGAFEPPSGQSPRTQNRREYQKKPLRSGTNTRELYDAYRKAQENSAGLRSRELEKARARRDRRIADAKRFNRLRRATIKALKASRLTKKVLYGQAHTALRRRIDEIRRDHKRSCESLPTRMSWADWLRQMALEGDQKALEALRARDSGQGLKGNVLAGQGRAHPASRPVDHITKHGTVISRGEMGVIRDDGTRISVSSGAKTPAVEVALKTAIERYGTRLSVGGTPTFKAEVLLAAVKWRLPISFADPSLESRRQSLLKKENPANERTRSTGSRQPAGGRARADAGGRGRLDRRGLGDTGTSAASHRDGARSGASGGPGSGRLSAQSGSGGRRAFAREPDPASLGRGAPPERRHRLRNLSQLGVVQFTRQSQVLLPGDVPSNVGQRRAQPNHPLRRPVDRPGIGRDHIAAQEQYLAEREAKRARGLNIPKYKRYSGDIGAVPYRGTRTINGYALALLQDKDEIVVMPVDQSTAKRLKRVTVGDVVTVTPAGTIRTSRGKSR